MGRYCTGGIKITQALFPPGTRSIANQMKLSPGIQSGGHVFLTGIVGSGTDGHISDDPEIQIRRAFEKIAQVLHEADLTCKAIVEMTSYHISLRDHFDLFSKIRGEFVQPPYPAWTAVEVAGLRREGAIVEIRVIAKS